MKKRRPSPEDEDEVRRTWDREESAAFTKLLVAQRAMETGENVQQLLGSVERRQNATDEDE